MLTNGNISLDQLTEEKRNESPDISTDIVGGIPWFVLFRIEKLRPASFSTDIYTPSAYLNIYQLVFSIPSRRKPGIYERG